MRLFFEFEMPVVQYGRVARYVICLKCGSDLLVFGGGGEVSQCLPRRRLLSRAATLLVVLCTLCVVPAAQAVDTDGDGLLDLLDVPGFDPNATGEVHFKERGIQDLDGASLLTNVNELGLIKNQITQLGTWRLRWT